MAKGSTCASRPSSTKDESCKRRRWATRWPDASRPPKKKGYFSKHSTRLNDAERLKSGRANGSGQVEGKAKTLDLRLKARGARWNKTSVRPMASLVCVRHSKNQWAAYWAVAA